MSRYLDCIVTPLWQYIGFDLVNAFDDALLTMTKVRKALFLSNANDPSKKNQSFG